MYVCTLQCLDKLIRILCYYVSLLDQIKNIYIRTYVSCLSLKVVRICSSVISPRYSIRSLYLRL